MNCLLYLIYSIIIVTAENSLFHVYQIHDLLDCLTTHLVIFPLFHLLRLFVTEIYLVLYISSFLPHPFLLPILLFSFSLFGNHLAFDLFGPLFLFFEEGVELNEEAVLHFRQIDRP